MKIGIIKNKFRIDKSGIDRYEDNIIKGSNTKVITSEDCNHDSIKVKFRFKILNKTYLWNNLLPFKIKKYNFDLIHNPGQIPIFKKFDGISLITIHDLSTFLFSKEHPLSRVIINKLILKRTIRNCNFIIVDSENTKKDVIKIFKVPEEKIDVVYLGVDEKYKILNKKQSLFLSKKYTKTDKFILYVGTLEPRKNIPNLIRAYCKIKDKLPYKLIITGKKGWKYKPIFDLISELKLEDDVIFTGYIPEEDLPALYNGASAFVFPSLYEGFGLPPLEAMACGCPVITSNTSSLPEVVGDAGIMVDPNDVDELAKQIERVLTDKKLRDSMIKKGLKQAKKFSWEKCAKETLKVYEKVYKETIKEFKATKFPHS